MAEKPTSLVWTAVKNSLTTTRPGDWQISGASMTQKRWQDFVEELLDSFPLFKVSLQGLAG
jgi:hypothetical protein